MVLIATSASAQKLQTVDKDGQPVPYASIIGEDGSIIGTTNLEGILDDVKGAEVVSITHVAYQPKKVKVGQGGRVTLEDADFDLPEVTVTKKPPGISMKSCKLVSNSPATTSTCPSLQY